MIDRFCVAVATGFHLSYIPVWLSRNLPQARTKRWTGAGLIGTLLGLLFLPLMPQDEKAMAVVLVVATVIASWISGRADRALGGHDDPRIIVDETVGFWAAAAGLPRETGIIALAFVLFRVLDAGKWPPYRWLERLPGGWGVVLDDVGAGVFANAIVRLCLWAGILKWT